MHQSPRDSPHMSPMNAGMYYASNYVQPQYVDMTAPTGCYYPQTAIQGYHSPKNILNEKAKKPTQMTAKAAPFIPKHAEQMTTKAAPFIPKNIEKPLPPTEIKVVSDDDPTLTQFLKQNKLGHLTGRFIKYGITESFLLKMNETEVNQLGLDTEDKIKLLEALEKTKNAGQRAIANLIDFE